MICCSERILQTKQSKSPYYRLYYFHNLQQKFSNRYQQNLVRHFANEIMAGNEARLTVCLRSHVWCWSKYRNFDSSVGVGDVDEQCLVVVVSALCRYREVDAERWRTIHADVEVEQRPARIDRITDDYSKRTCDPENNLFGHAIS